MGVILTRTTSSQGASGSGVFTQIEKLAIEMEMAFKASQESYYKELIYSGDTLIDIEYWTDSGKTTKIFNKDLFYNQTGLLSKTILTRESDNSKLAKLLSYDISDNLTSVIVSAG